jgi:predicted nucleic acid-binding protein
MAATRFVVDTDVVIDYLRRGDPVIAEALLRFRCALTSIAFFELYAVHTLPERQRVLLTQLVASVDILPLHSAAAEQAAQVWRMLSGRGQVIGLSDTLSAGICLTYGLPILTRNAAHFGRVESLQVIAPDELAAYLGSL